ncbi:MAG: hypothetical protein AB1425_18270 [Actinomycetota bacterium]
MIPILDRFEETLPRLAGEHPGERRRELIALFDESYLFKRLHEHHDQRERNPGILEDAGHYRRDEEGTVPTSVFHRFCPAR